MQTPIDCQSTLNNQVLVATPLLQHPYFSETVIFIFAHNVDGANGLILNRPISDLSLEHFAQKLGILGADALDTSECVRLGGPLSQKQGFVVYEGATRVEVSRSTKMLEEIMGGKSPKRAIVVLGYCAWGAGQLEQEIVDNCWFLGPTENPDLLFDTPPEMLWEFSSASIGINFSTLSREIGHA